MTLVLTGPTRRDMSSIGTPLLESSETKLCRSSRGVQSAAGLLLVASALISSPALASHPEVSLPGSNFEIDTDASLKVDDAASALKDFIAPTPLNLATCGAIKVTKTRKHAADGPDRIRMQVSRSP